MKRTTLYNLPGPAVDFYDFFHDEKSIPPIRGDVAFYRGLARKTGGPVLELACGTGRVTLPLARAGFRVTGLDLSPHMLRIARKKAGALPVTFVRGNMKAFDLGKRFRLILIPFRSFQALTTVEEQRACLACVRRHLAPGGLFCVNLFDPKLEYCVHGRSEVFNRYREARDPATKRVSRLRVLWRRNDAVSQVMHERWVHTLHQGRRLLRKTARDLVLRWTYRTEMRHLLELEGFEAIACWSDFRKSPPRYGKEQVWVTRAASPRDPSRTRASARGAGRPSRGR